MSTNTDFKILEQKAVLSRFGSEWTREVNVVSWSDGPAVVDIRDWSPDHKRMSHGIQLSEGDAIRLVSILRDQLSGEDFSSKEPERVVYESDDRFGPKIFRTLGAISTNSRGWRKLVTVTSWCEGAPKVDIRDWEPGFKRMSRGISLTREEADTLALIDPSIPDGVFTIPTLADIEAFHSIAARLESLQEQYLDISKAFRTSLDKNGDFITMLYRLTLEAGKMAEKAELLRREPVLDCCNMPVYDEDTLARYSASIRKIESCCGLLNLPDRDKDALKACKDLEKKADLLEQIASKY